MGNEAKEAGKPEFIRYEDVKREWLKDPEFKKAYDDLELEFAIKSALIKKRAEEGLTQKELAKRIGTKQSAISRFERGVSNPTLAFVQKLARELGVKISVS